MYKLQSLKRICVLLTGVCTLGCGETVSRSSVDSGVRPTQVEHSAQAKKIVGGARWQIDKTVSYDPAYVAMQYPMGDLPITKGVCTDVVIRALRRAEVGDLQQKVHRDMKANFTLYPKIWGLKRPDKNIDHRRVPNLKTYFTRQGWSLAVSKKASDYLPGDLVTCTVGRNLPHIMIVSDFVNSDGQPLVIHNIGAGVKEEDNLFSYPITGHYRVK